MTRFPFQTYLHLELDNSVDNLKPRARILGELVRV